jgi:hypothetical protein
MPQRRQHTTRKHIRLTRDGQEAIQSWADGRGISFSAALESLARIGPGQPIDEALAPALVSVVRVEVQRQMHRLASLLAANAIEAGVSGRLSGAAFRALRPKDYDPIKRAARIDTVHSLLRRNAPPMVAALLQGGFLQVLQALTWLAVYSVALGGLYLPIWLLQRIAELLGPLSGLLVLGLILFGAWKLLFGGSTFRRREPARRPKVTLARRAGFLMSRF